MYANEYAWKRREDKDGEEGVYALEHYSGGNGLPAAYLVLPSAEGTLERDPNGGRLAPHWRAANRTGGMLLLLTTYDDDWRQEMAYLQPMDMNLWAKLAGLTLHPLTDGAPQDYIPSTPRPNADGRGEAAAAAGLTPRVARVGPRDGPR